MSLWEILLLAVGLSMDAFAVSLCQGLSLERFSLRHLLVVGAWYGGFQALMPVLGYLLAARFAALISGFDHWIAFLLLAWIGGNMLREALSKRQEEEGSLDASLAPLTMLKLAVATSIDALAVGVSMACMQTAVVTPALIIGLTTFLLSGLGVSLGRLVRSGAGRKAELTGGLILIMLGVKILLEHTLLV